jgi:cystathionine beta-lyase/cystathionine gamma-synthase
MHGATRVIRAGLPIPAQGEPFLPGPIFAGTYDFSGEPETSLYTYGRYHNPTCTRFEQALSELEGGSALVFASGMAAVTAVLGVTLPDAWLTIKVTYCTDSVDQSTALKGTFTADKTGQYAWNGTPEATCQGILQGPLVSGKG